MTWTITQNELKRIWFSPIAWVLFALALLILGLLLLVLLNNFYTEVQDKLIGLKQAPGLTDLVIAPYMFWVAVVGIILVPLFAVRSSTEERQFGSDVLLNSAPLSVTQIVVGKYLALTLLALLFTMVCSSYALILGYFTVIDYGKTLAGMFAIFLSISSFNAAALFIANLTRTPIIATAGILGALLIMVMLYLSGSATASSSELFLYLANFSHLTYLIGGSIDTAHVAYFILFAILFLVLCIRHLQLKKKY